MHYHTLRNYRIIQVMFWAFPYLLWQAFGHWSGFVVGVIVAVVLTTMFNSLIHTRGRNTAFAGERQASQMTEAQPQFQREETYQSGYRGEAEPYRSEPQIYQAEEPQAQYDEMLVPYPQETMPPMEQRVRKG